MNPDEIIVGKKYKHDRYPDLVFLGAAMDSTKEGGDSLSVLKFKTFVIIGTESDGLVGMIVPQPEFCWKGYWDGFALLEQIKS